jgi:hypothetical protein
MEFTWNTWIYIENVFSESSSTYNRIFSKGGDEKINHEISLDGTTVVENKFLNVTPGLFLEKGLNKLVFVLNTFDESESVSKTSIPYEIIEIEDVPIHKWVCCTMRIQNKTVDVYINGVLTKRVNLERVPRQNYGNIHVGDYTSGLNGYVSALRYFNYAIGNGKIQDIVQQGPNLKMIGSGMESSPPYLSMNWYLK